MAGVETQVRFERIRNAKIIAERFPLPLEILSAAIENAEWFEGFAGDKSLGIFLIWERQNMWPEIHVSMTCHGLLALQAIRAFLILLKSKGVIRVSTFVPAANRKMKFAVCAAGFSRHSVANDGTVIYARQL